jgi:Ni/Fe-hydrogenase subunit HybB-like protein
VYSSAEGGSRRLFKEKLSGRQKMKRKRFFLAALVCVWLTAAGAGLWALARYEFTPGDSGVRYLPKWTELAVTAGIVAAGFAIFGLAAKYLPIFPEEEAARHSEEAAETEHSHVAS